MFVCETPNSAAWAGRRPEFKGIDPSASVLHSLTPYFPFLGEKKNPPEIALALTEEGINSSRAISRREPQMSPLAETRSFAPPSQGQNPQQLVRGGGGRHEAWWHLFQMPPQGLRGAATVRQCEVKSVPIPSLCLHFLPSLVPFMST